MSETKETKAPDQDAKPAEAQASAESMFSDGRKFLAITYVCYIASFLLGGIPSIVGVILAYTTDAQDNPVVASHRAYAIRTFWFGLLGGFIGFLLSLVFIGVFVILAVAVWMLVRSIKGIIALNDNKVIEDPKTMLW